MRTHWKGIGSLVLGLAVLASPPANGQDKKEKDEPKVKDGVYRIEVFQGTRRSVEVVGKGDVSPSLLAAEQDAARAESEASYVRELQDLKRQYVANERIFAARRLQVQMELYGNSSQTTTSSFLAYGDGFRVGGYPYWGFYPGYYGYGINGYLGSVTTVTRDLSIGAGPEGSLQSDMSKLIVSQATPEYAALAGRNYHYAVATADEIRKNPKKGPGPAGFEQEEKPTKRAKLTLKNGKDVVSGLLLESRDKDWIRLKTDKGETRVRASEVLMEEIEPVKEEK